MPLASYVLSLCLHIGIILIIWLWPASKPLVYPEQPVMISLVDGAPGGNKEPSPILGPMGAKADGESAPAPAAKKAEVAQQEREETRAAPIKAPKDERPMKKEEPKKPELKPAPKQEVQPKEKAISPKKKDIKEEPKKKDEEKPKPQAKPQEQKQDQKQKTSGKDTKDSENKGAEDKDAIASALNQARRKATSRTGSDSGNPYAPSNRPSPRPARTLAATGAEAEAKAAVPAAVVCIRSISVRSCWPCAPTGATLPAAAPTCSAPYISL